MLLLLLLLLQLLLLAGTKSSSLYLQKLTVQHRALGLMVARHLSV